MVARIARRAALTAPFLLSSLGAARAQGAWPARPVVLMVPWAPGGSNDLTARLLAPHLSERFGQSFVVENRPGGGGAVGMGQVARARPDGLTLLFAVSTTGTSTGAVNSLHDSYTGLGGGVTLLNILLGEVAPGGVGTGLYGMLVLAVIAVFLAGLMVGRTPEYLGKKLGRREVTAAAVSILAMPTVVLLGTGGVLAELFRDVSIRPAPVDLEEAREMVGEVKGLRALAGWRGLPRGDLEALASAVVSLSRLAARDDVAEAEINPAIIGPEGAGVTVADAWVVRA